MRIRGSLIGPILALALVSGCGQSASVAPVHGRLTCNGKPVKEAVVLFSPLGGSENARETGKAASGSTDGDGHFTLTTFKPGDGALVGRHRASVILDNTVRLPCGNSKVVMLEVKPGDNELNIDMGQ